MEDRRISFAYSLGSKGLAAAPVTFSAKSVVEGVKGNTDELSGQSRLAGHTNSAKPWCCPSALVISHMNSPAASRSLRGKRHSSRRILGTCGCIPVDRRLLGPSVAEANGASCGTSLSDVDGQGLRRCVTPDSVRALLTRVTTAGFAGPQNSQIARVRSDLLARQATGAD